MDAIIEFLQQMDYAGMALTSFIAGSFFPFSSEVIMTAFLKAGSQPFPLFLCATIGNVMGSMFNYWVGTFGRLEWVEKYLHVKREKLESTQRWLQGHGAWMGFFCFVPVLGSALSVALGYMRANPYIAFVSIFLGKAMRYAILVWLVTTSHSLFVWIIVGVLALSVAYSYLCSKMKQDINMEKKFDQLTAFGASLAFLSGIVAAVSILLSLSAFDMAEFDSLEVEHPGIRGLMIGNIGALLGMVIMLLGLLRARRKAAAEMKQPMKLAIAGVASFVVAMAYMMVLVSLVLRSLQPLSFGEAVSLIEEEVGSKVLLIVVAMLLRVALAVTGFVCCYCALGKFWKAECNVLVAEQNAETSVSAKKGSCWVKTFRVSLIVLSAYSIFLAIPVLGDAIFAVFFLLVALVQLACAVFAGKHVFRV